MSPEVGDVVEQMDAATTADSGPITRRATWHRICNRLRAERTGTLETEAEEKMRPSLTMCAAAALALLMVKDASAQSGVPSSYQRGHARLARVGSPRPTATRLTLAPKSPHRLDSDALTRLAFRAAFHTYRGRRLTASALRQYRGRGEPTFWDAAYVDRQKVNIYLNNPDRISVPVATVEVKPHGVLVNGRRVMSSPNPGLGSRTSVRGEKQAPSSLFGSGW